MPTQSLTHSLILSHPSHSLANFSTFRHPLTFSLSQTRLFADSHPHSLSQRNPSLRHFLAVSLTLTCCLFHSPTHPYDSPTVSLTTHTIFHQIIFLLTLNFPIHPYSIGSHSPTHPFTHLRDHSPPLTLSFAQLMHSLILSLIHSVIQILPPSLPPSLSRTQRDTHTRTHRTHATRRAPSSAVSSDVTYTCPVPDMHIASYQERRVWTRIQSVTPSAVKSELFLGRVKPIARNIITLGANRAQDSSSRRLQIPPTSAHRYDSHPSNQRSPSPRTRRPYLPHDLRRHQDCTRDSRIPSE